MAHWLPPNTCGNVRAEEASDWSAPQGAGSLVSSALREAPFPSRQPRGRKSARTWNAQVQKPEAGERSPDSACATPHSPLVLFRFLLSGL